MQQTCLFLPLNEDNYESSLNLEVCVAGMDTPTRKEDATFSVVCNTKFHCASMRWLYDGCKYYFVHFAGIKFKVLRKKINSYSWIRISAS